MVIDNSCGSHWVVIKTFDNVKDTMAVLLLTFVHRRRIYHRSYLWAERRPI